MDWAKAKTYIILCLFILNILLLGFNFYKSSKYITNLKSIEYTKSVLEKENVVLDCGLPVFYAPMKNSALKKYSYDFMALKNIFFDKDEQLKQTIEFENRIFYTDTGKKLTVSGNSVTFEFEDSDIKPDDVITKIMNKISKNFCVMKKMRDDTFENTRIVVFNQEFNGYIAFNNSLSFCFTNKNNCVIKFMYNEPIDFTGEKTEIYSPMEAVFNFSAEIKKIYELDKYIITNVDIGYFFENSENIHESIYTAYPCYRIFVQGINEPFYINACNNTFYYET